VPGTLRDAGGNYKVGDVTDWKTIRPGLRLQRKDDDDEFQ